MIDPDNIILVDKNKNTQVTINNVVDFDLLVWDTDDEKEMNKFYKTVENEVRHSYEYKEMINYLRDNFGMNECSFIKTSGSDAYNVKIEVHHYPFTLYDIVTIVYNKRQYYGETLDLQMVAKEVTMLHYKLLVGLIPLSKTVHQLVHEGKLFIPVYNVLGRWQEFIKIYKQFCDPAQLETIERIEQYSRDYSDLQSTTILDNNNISINVTDTAYKRPDLLQLQTTMSNRITAIKENGYRLPSLIDKQTKDTPEERRAIIKPIYFVDEKGNRIPD